MMLLISNGTLDTTNMEELNYLWLTFVWLTAGLLLIRWHRKPNN